METDRVAGAEITDQQPDWGLPGGSAAWTGAGQGVPLSGGVWEKLSFLLEPQPPRQETQLETKPSSPPLAPPHQQEALRKRKQQAWRPPAGLDQRVEDRKEASVAAAQWTVRMVRPQDGQHQRDQAERGVSAVGFGFDFKRQGSPWRFKSRGETRMDLDCSKAS